MIEKVLNRNQSETGGLARNLEVKVNARVMLTVNIDIADRLINGQIGKVKHICYNNINGHIVKVYNMILSSLMIHRLVLKELIPILLENNTNGYRSKKLKQVL